jgi:HK97 family phage portal protein
MAFLKSLSNGVRGFVAGWSFNKDLSWADQLRLFRADKEQESSFKKLTTAQQLKVIKNNAIVYACVTVKAQAIQQAPLMVEEYNAESGTWAPTEIKDHPLLYGFNHNPDLTQSEMIQFMSMHLDLTGKSFQWKWKSKDGVTRELWPLPPSWVEIVRREDLRSQKPKETSRVISHFHVRTPDGNHEWDILPEDMIYTRRPDPNNLWDGLSRICAATKAITLDNRGDEYKGESMDTLRLPGVVVKTRKPLSPRQKEDLRAILRQKIGGDARENAVIISGEEAAIELLNPMKDFDWVGYSSLNETRICMCFGVPPIVIGALVGLENSPWSNTGEAKRWMYQNTIVGMWGMMSDSLNKEQVPEGMRDTNRIVFDTSEIKELRDDIEQVWRRAREAFNDGLIMRAEGREMIGYDSTDADNVYKYNATTLLVPADENDMMSVELTEEEQMAGIDAMEDGEL